MINAGRHETTLNPHTYENQIGMTDAVFCEERIKTLIVAIALISVALHKKGSVKYKNKLLVIKLMVSWHLLCICYVIILYLRLCKNLKGSDMTHWRENASTHVFQNKGHNVLYKMSKMSGKNIKLKIITLGRRLLDEGRLSEQIWKTNQRGRVLSWVFLTFRHYSNLSLSHVNVKVQIKAVVSFHWGLISSIFWIDGRA